MKERLKGREGEVGREGRGKKKMREKGKNEGKLAIFFPRE